MENREIINGLKYIKSWKCNGDAQVYEIISNAISALEQQEAAKIVVGKSRGGVTLWHECSKCREPVDAKDTYCSGCGRKLIYEEG